jgi:hypothetical protein
MMLKKVIWTSIIAALLTAAIGFASQYELPMFGFGPPIPTSG